MYVRAQHCTRASTGLICLIALLDSSTLFASLRPHRTGHIRGLAQDQRLRMREALLSVACEIISIFFNVVRSFPGRRISHELTTESVSGSGLQYSRASAAGLLVRALSRIECDELLTFELHICAKVRGDTITIL
jgi:hypothetical protein